MKVPGAAGPDLELCAWRHWSFGRNGIAPVESGGGGLAAAQAGVPVLPTPSGLLGWQNRMRGAGGQCQSGLGDAGGWRARGVFMSSGR